MMYIYKITNLINNKVYIGQVYNKSVEERFKRHCTDKSALKHSYIDRAIEKYGPENFVVETIDIASDLDELNNKEKYWIKKYNSTDRTKGYNLTDGGDGGNTYRYKTEDEMISIKNKLSESLSGSNNGMSKMVKIKNVITNEIIHFDTIKDLLTYFGVKNKTQFFNIATNKRNTLYRGVWNVAYEENEFTEKIVHNPSTKRGCKMILIDTVKNETIEFDSQNKLNSFLKIKKNTLDYSKTPIEYKQYIIIKS